MSMRIVVREASLPSERAGFADMLARYLTPLSNECRFDWLYMKGPHGAARGWIAADEERGSVIGVAGAFPRLMWMDKKEVLAWVLGDFCLDSTYRSLGPALQLQKACMSLVDLPGTALVYDFPSASMLAIYRRLGVVVTGRMLRLGRLLRVDRQLREVIKGRFAQRAVAAVGNTLLRLRPSKFVPGQSLELVVHEGPCGEEFSGLARKQRDSLGICIHRTAEYLNWRYVNNPLARYEFITVRTRGKLQGYAVWTQSGEDARVVDWFGENNPAIAKGLLETIAALVRDRGVMTLSVWLNDGHPWVSWCSEMGFYVRDCAPIVCVLGQSLTQRADLLDTKWLLMQGDRDS